MHFFAKHSSHPRQCKIRYYVVYKGLAYFMGFFHYFHIEIGLSATTLLTYLQGFTKLIPDIIFQSSTIVSTERN